MIRYSASSEESQALAVKAYELMSTEQPLRTTTSDIMIEAAEGILRLTGRVRTNIMRERAGRLAQVAANGWVLENHLISDEALCYEIAARLAQEPNLDDTNIRCETYLGTAYLKGSVRNAEQRDRALQIAGQVPGILRVVDHLNVRS